MSLYFAEEWTYGFSFFLEIDRNPYLKKKKIRILDINYFSLFALCPFILQRAGSLISVRLFIWWRAGITYGHTDFFLF